MREETMIHVEKSPMKTEEIREVWAERLLKYKMDIQSGKPTDEFAIIEGFLSVEVGGGWINPNDNKQPNGEDHKQNRKSGDVDKKNPKL